MREVPNPTIDVLQRFWEAHYNGILFGVILTSLFLFVLLGRIYVFQLIQRVSARARKNTFIHKLRRPVQAVVVALITLMVLPAVPLPAPILSAIERALDLCLLGYTAWILIILLENLEESLANRYRIDMSDNLLARRIRTRLQVFHQITVGLVIFLTVATALMIFPKVRSLGASLLASAGIAGIIAGMAARPALANLIAGIQIALTEPIRLEDVVVVEGEWGWIEQIYSTYVVVRIWDLRRMILPLSYFIEHPFQNWTRESATILGSVFIYTDYRVPVEALRTELQAILKSTPLWMGAVCGLQVSDATEHSIQLRALMDASDSGKAWDLRCYVREKLLTFIQTRYPESLPRTRLEVMPPIPPVPPAMTAKPKTR